jgi:hypothetical protein
MSMGEPEHRGSIRNRTAIARSRKALLRAFSRIRGIYPRSAPSAEAMRLITEAALFAGLLIMALLIGFAFMIIAAE